MALEGPHSVQQFESSSLVSYLDKKVIVLLRDGRSMIGTMGSFDQHGAIVLLKTIERMIFRRYYCDVPMGVFIARGEEVIFCGEVDPTVPQLPPHMLLVTRDEINERRKAARNTSYLKRTMRTRMSFLLGIGLRFNRGSAKNFISGVVFTLALVGGANASVCGEQI
ncbi:hypothetical protein R1sor_005943 [Riccia sorocarpa]|uniref:U6 snRNA-associated Sm-like protein LSm1 n=1 Tax=Riccia sorocarpa TaxID=122646 RepID=A0ABD3HPI9_9MARC